MDRLKQVWGMATIAIAIVATTGLLYAADHPTKRSTGSTSKTELSKDDLANAIEKYVKSDSGLKGGFFLIYDIKSSQSLVLTLDRVHRKRLSKIGRNEYFACADFKTQQGKVYDLDMFMKGSDKNNLKITEISIHKEAGKERYTWYQSGDVWKKKTGGAKKGSASKKPEHPR